MPTFKNLEISDKPWVDALLRGTNRRSCEYSFSCVMMWAGVYSLSAAEVEGCFVVRSLHRGAAAYLFPAGSNAAAALHVLDAQCREEKTPLRLYSLTDCDRKLLESTFPNRFAFTALADAREYLYDVQSLRTLAGKKLHSKRTHINRFAQVHPGWSYEEIGRGNLLECRTMHEKWLADLRGQQSASLLRESKAVDIAFDHFFDFGLLGGCLRTEEGIVAYAMGERLGGGSGDTFDVRIEKAFYEVPGAYAMMNREFARATGDAAYINREDDAGDEGLRRAKLSYRPALFIEKFSALSR